MLDPAKAITNIELAGESKEYTFYNSAVFTYAEGKQVED